eukprot:296256-Chlamydomonas_euryale.AAC.7
MSSGKIDAAKKASFEAKYSQLSGKAASSSSMASEQQVGPLTHAVDTFTSGSSGRKAAEGAWCGINRPPFLACLPLMHTCLRYRASMLLRAADAWVHACTSPTDPGFFSPTFIPPLLAHLLTFTSIHPSTYPPTHMPANPCTCQVTHALPTAHTTSPPSPPPTHTHTPRPPAFWSAQAGESMPQFSGSSMVRAGRGATASSTSVLDPPSGSIGGGPGAAEGGAGRGGSVEAHTPEPEPLVPVPSPIGEEIDSVAYLKVWPLSRRVCASCWGSVCVCGGGQGKRTLVLASRQGRCPERTDGLRGRVNGCR